MTLVAAFRIDGVPILIGDFLVTDSAASRRHLYLPTRPQLAKERPTLNGRRVAGLRKKIQLIGERLAVGFTGDLRSGETLMSALVKRFASEIPSARDLQLFLSGYGSPRHAELVGWVWEKRPLCFHWNSLKPTHLELRESAVAGSGSTHFLNTIMPASHASDAGNIHTAVDRATYKAVVKIGSILMSELTTAENLNSHYGYGAEVIYWDGGKFSYVDKICFSFWNILVNSDNSLLVRPSNIAGVYKNHGHFSVMQISHLAPKTGMLPGFEATDTFVQLMTPLSERGPMIDPSLFGRESYESPIWFTGAAIRNKTTGASGLMALSSEDGDGIEPLVTHKHGVLYLKISEIHGMLPAEFMTPSL